MDEQQYECLRRVVAALVALDPPADTLAGQLLDEFAAKCEAYEREHYPLDPHARIADRIDGYDRDDIGESPDY